MVSLKNHSAKKERCHPRIEISLSYSIYHISTNFVGPIVGQKKATMKHEKYQNITGENNYGNYGI
jgi:hypothetical protein